MTNSPQNIINERNVNNGKIFVFGIGEVDTIEDSKLNNFSLTNNGIYVQIQSMCYFKIF